MTPPPHPSHRGRPHAARVAAALACALGVLLGLSTGAAHAAHVLSVQAARQGSSVSVALRVALDAPGPALFRALLHYEAMPRYDPELRALRIEATSDPDRVRLILTIHTCVLFFCKTIHQQQIMTAHPAPGGGVLQAQFVPASGAFGGQGRWVVAPCTPGASAACLDAHLELEPHFWVPPMIGPWLIRRKMHEEAVHISEGLERMAHASGWLQPEIR